MIYRVGSCGLVVQVIDRGGSVMSCIAVSCIAGNPDDSNNELTQAFNAIESLVLAHACLGIDVAEDRYGAGVDYAVQSILNELA